jgi:glycosyltransferase involved in cell wall biosynthesis
MHSGVPGRAVQRDLESEPLAPTGAGGPHPLELDPSATCDIPAASVNGRFLGRPVTGVERYAYEVTRRLGSRLRVVRAPSWAQGTRGHLWEQLVLPRRVGRGQLLWSPANSGPVRLENQVVTIHDVGPMDHPEWFQGAFAALFRRVVPRVARRARRVITSSRFSRDRLVERCGLDPGQVVVVAPGVDPVGFRPPSQPEIDAVRARYRLPQRYLLAVGSLSVRKNLTVLLSASNLLRLRGRGLGLVIVGSPTHTAPAHRLDSPDSWVRVLGRVPDSNLPALYGGSAAFVLPSLYEGFGLPVLEAMACGTPVVASKWGGVPEAAGDAGILFDPENPEELAHRIQELLEDPRRCEEVVARGLRRAQEFTWDRTAKGVLNTLSRARS